MFELGDVGNRFCFGKVFVNTIADIVHRAVKDNEGAPNKNIGSAFLLVWRLSGSMRGSQNHHECTVGDAALKSLIRARY